MFNLSKGSNPELLNFDEKLELLDSLLENKENDIFIYASDKVIEIDNENGNFNVQIDYENKVVTLDKAKHRRCCLDLSGKVLCIVKRFLKNTELNISLKFLKRTFPTVEDFICKYSDSDSFLQWCNNFKINLDLFVDSNFDGHTFVSNLHKIFGSYGVLETVCSNMLEDDLEFLVEDYYIQLIGKNYTLSVDFKNKTIFVYHNLSKHHHNTLPINCETISKVMLLLNNLRNNGLNISNFDLFKTLLMIGMNLSSKEDIKMSKNQPVTYNELKKLVEDESINLGDIDTSKITDMSYLFQDIKRDDWSGIETWDVSNATDMSHMFSNSNFNVDISNWNVGNVENMSHMFSYADFNEDISKWNVSNVEDMRGMFYRSKFNSDISKWNVKNVEDMGYMFCNSNFNGDISDWNVSNVTDMSHMFESANFNGDISKWNVSKVDSMSGMFMKSKFNGDISNWKLKETVLSCNMFDGCDVQQIVVSDSLEDVKKQCNNKDVLKDLINEYLKQYGVYELRKVFDDFIDQGENYDL